MSEWKGSWKLSISTDQNYDELKTGKFRFKDIGGGKYKVEKVRNATKPKWLGAIFQKQAGPAGPILPWPLHSPVNSDHAMAAAKFIGDMVQARWGQPAQLFEHLVGQINVAGVPTSIVLFKAEKGVFGGKDFLVGFLLGDVNQSSSPGGSVSGVRT